MITTITKCVQPRIASVRGGGKLIEN